MIEFDGLADDLKRVRRHLSYISGDVSRVSGVGGRPVDALFKDLLQAMSYLAFAEVEARALADLEIRLQRLEKDNAE